MNSIHELKSGLRDKLAAAIGGVDFSLEFSPRALYGTLDRPLVTLYLKKMTAKDCALMNYMGEENGRLLYSKQAELSIGFSIDCPVKENNPAVWNNPNDIFLQICDTLLFDDSYAVSTLSCGETVYQQKYEVMSLTCEGSFTDMLTKQAEEARFDRVDIQASAK